MIGNSAPKPIPLFKLPLQILSAEKEINQGPSVQPISPKSAKIPNILFPPSGNFLAARLKVPGHIILIKNPVNAQNTREIYGFSDTETTM